MSKLVGNPVGFCVSAVRRLATMHRVVGEDDLVAELNGCSGISATDRADALAECERRRIIHRRAWASGLYDSGMYAG